MASACEPAVRSTAMFGRVKRQVAYSKDLGRLLGPGGNWAEKPEEAEGDTEGKSQPHHVEFSSLNFCPRHLRIGFTTSLCQVLHVEL